jgi:putative ABC transport system permease protein
MAPRWRKVIRDLSSHRFRTLLVVVSIAIGMFAVGVVLGTRQVLIREFEVDHAASVPRNVSYRTSDFGDDVVRRAERAEGVAAAQAQRSVTLRYRRGAGETDRTLAVQAFMDYDHIAVEKVVTTGEGRWPPGPGEIVLERSVLGAGDYVIGDTLEIERADGETLELRVTGFAHDINAVPAQFVGYETGYVAFGTLSDLGEPEKYNRLSLAFSEPDISWVDASRLATRLREDVLESRGVRVLYTDVPEPGSHFLGDIFKAVSLLLLALGVLSLGLSAFLVVNTVSALMAQQVRQVGIMKAIGGSAGQVETLYVVTVAVYGALAVAIGLPAAAAGSRWFTDFAARILNFRVADHTLPGWVVAVEVAVGLLVPLLAAASPVRRGARMSVVRALNATGMTGTTFGHGLADRVLGAIRGLPRPVALSLRNTFLRKGRLALTLATLTLASGVVMSVFSVQASIGRTVGELESWWRYEAQFVFATPQKAAALEAEARDVPGVVGTESWLTYPATLTKADGTEDESFGIVGLDPATDFIAPRLVEGRWLAAGDTDAIVVNTDAQNVDAALGLGQTVTLSVRGEERRWRVVGVIKGQLGGPTIYCSADVLTDLVGDAGVTRLLVRGADDSPEAQRRLLDAVETRLNDAGYPVSGARTRSGLADQLSSQLGILVTFLVIMAAILASVGVIGLTGTMTINVLESTREIGVMRATGAQHGAIYQIFVTEGAAVGAIAWAAGALLAYPMSLGLVRALTGAIGLPLSYAFSWPGVGAWLALMLVISAVASILPAFRASQVSVRDAIAYE